MTTPLKGVRHIPGFGTTLPTDKADRQAALALRMKQQSEKEKSLHEKLASRYDDRKDITEAERRQGDQV